MSKREVTYSQEFSGHRRHLAGVERWWFRIQFAHEDLPLLHYSEDEPDQDFDDLGGDVDEAFCVWEQEVARSREIVAATPSTRPPRRRTAVRRCPCGGW